MIIKLINNYYIRTKIKNKSYVLSEIDENVTKELKIF